MQVVNRLDPKLVSSQFYSQIAVARTWVQAVTQDLMDTGAIEYTPGENAICKTGEHPNMVEGGKECEGIVRAKRNTTAFPCSIDFGYSQRETGLACDPLQDFFGAARSDSQGWKNYPLTPVCTSWKRSFDADGAVSGEKGWIEEGPNSAYGGDFGPKMKTLYKTIDWQKCSRSSSSHPIDLNAICYCVELKTNVPQVPTILCRSFLSDSISILQSICQNGKRQKYLSRYVK